MPLTKDSATVDPVLQCRYAASSNFTFTQVVKAFTVYLDNSRLMGAFALQLPSRFFDALRHFLTYKGNVASMRAGLLPCQATKQALLFWSRSHFIYFISRRAFFPRPVLGNFPSAGIPFLLVRTVSMKWFPVTTTLSKFYKDEYQLSVTSMCLLSLNFAFTSMHSQKHLHEQIFRTFLRDLVIE